MEERKTVEDFLKERMKSGYEPNKDFSNSITASNNLQVIPKFSYIFFHHFCFFLIITNGYR